MIAVVFGASGFIGFHLTEQLLLKGHTVYAVCRRDIGNLKYIVNNEHLITLISDDIESIVGKIDADVWYHLAWEGARGEMRANPEIQIKNELVAVCAMNIAKKIGCKKIIFTGTVYENICETILNTENFDRNAFYIMSKKHTRETTYEFSKKIGIDYVWCSLCQPVGKFMKDNQLLSYAVKKFRNNEVTCFGSCSQYFDIIDVRDFVEALIIIGMNETSKNFYYIGSGMPRILRDYLTEAAEICGYGLDIGFNMRPDDGMIFKKEWFDCSDFINEFGVANYKPFKKIVADMANYV